MRTCTALHLISSHLILVDCYWLSLLTSVLLSSTHRLIYAAGTVGAFVSADKGAHWNALHVMISTTNNCTSGFSGCNHQVDRVQHDFQVCLIGNDLLYYYCYYYTSLLYCSFFSTIPSSSSYYY